jgi:protein involved in polysaccharide export with SLBB domain
MSNSVQSVQAVHPLTQTHPAAQAPKAPAQTTAQTAPQDKVTISPQAQQALAKNAKPAAGGNVDHDGDSH